MAALGSEEHDSLMTKQVTPELTGGKGEDSPLN